MLSRIANSIVESAEIERPIERPPRHIVIAITVQWIETKEKVIIGVVAADLRLGIADFDDGSIASLVQWIAVHSLEANGPPIVITTNVTAATTVVVVLEGH